MLNKLMLFKDLDINDRFLFEWEVNYQDRIIDKASRPILPRFQEYIIAWVKTGETSYKALKNSPLYSDNRKYSNKKINYNQKGHAYENCTVFKLM